MRPLNEATIEHVKRWEGCRLKSYRDIAGIWTVGYGLTSGAGIIEVGPETTLTQAEADWYLEKTLAKFADEIRPMITAPINENQFGAFLSLAYNIGSPAFKRSSALRHFNDGDLDKVPASMRLWRKAGGKVVQGLVNRREAEVALFLMPVPDKPEEKASRGRTSATQSTTVQASVVQGATAIGGAVGALTSLDGTAQVVALVGCFAVLLLAGWIFKERLRKWGSGDR